jgi:Telomeric single stranded DNA binding POT1/CDC13
MTNISLQLFAKNIEELPRIFRVGDIIRVHRVNVNEFQN